MSDRLKRSKKKTGDAKAEPGPAPLQPAYYDTDNTPETHASPVEEASHEEPAVEASEPEAAAEAPASSGDDAAARPAARRRRGRGGRGRGRGGARTPVAAETVPVEAEAPVAEAPVAAPAARAPKGTVILAIGLPGSGKSSWFKRHKITALSSDLLRSLLFDDVNEQRFQDLVFSNLRSMLKARLIARRPLNYVDATNLTPQERHGWIKLAKDFQYDVQAVYFDVPLELCLERNQKRTRVVAEDVVKRLSAKLKPPTFEEGFTKITVVRVKKKDSEVAEEVEA
ncbi:MAG TPA: AAA family ATPase [Terriglobales bacterium]|nr:AAA family ATPase [Terriglobales bacterium]